MRNVLVVNLWLPCQRCGCDLNGQVAAAACPDCGTPVRETILQPIGRVVDGNRRQSEFHRLSEMVGYSVDAFLFVLNVVANVTRPTGGGAARRHTTAGALIEAFRRRSRTYFADNSVAAHVLNDWRLTSSEDVGRLVFALVDVGLLTVNEGDRIEDFDGLFTLDTLFR